MEMLVLKDFGVVKRIKPVYVLPFKKEVRFTILDDKTEVRFNGDRFNDIKSIFRLDVEKGRLSDSELFAKLHTYLRYEESRDMIIDYLLYFKDRWLDGKKLSKKEFMYFSKIVLEDLFSRNGDLNLRKFFLGLNRNEKCDIIHGVFAAVLFNRNITFVY